jgi:hypothetical protein
LHVWRRPWSSKPVEGLNKALSGFDSHTLPINRLVEKSTSLLSIVNPENWTTG